MNHTMYRHALVKFLACLAFCTSPALRAADASPAQDFKALRQDIDGLKQSQETIGKDVAEIKKLLQSMLPPPPVRPIDAVLDVAKSPSKGQKNAKLTLVEFSDYQCPFCRRQADVTIPQLEKNYIANGKLRYVFRDFPMESIHPQAAKAAEAAHCAAEQGKYWEMHDKLFANQQALEPDKLVEHAKGIGLKAEPFKTCIDGGKYAQSVSKDKSEGERLGMTATPTMMLGINNGDSVKLVKVLVGALPYAMFKEEIDKLLAETPDKN
jgi:protein-disulfide isomerase